MTHRMTHIIITFALTGLAIFLCILQGMLAPPPARALSGDGHGPGYLSTDGWWLGTYHLDDGAQGFCLNAGKPSPTNHVLDYTDGEALGWFTAEQSARLAYISRAWAGTGDSFTAAAGQIATWLVAGLGDHTPEELAARAGADAAGVLARAHEMTDEAARLGSTGVHANTVVELAPTGPGRIRVELTVDRLSGQEQLPPGAHHARVTLAGATFADGSTAADVLSGTDVPIIPTGTETTVAVNTIASFAALPYGNRLKVALPRDDAQAVLMAVPATAQARADASTTGPSPLPFQPIVSTVTDTATAEPGVQLTDHLTVSVDTAEGLLPAWGVRAVAGGFAPISATVESTLLGPFTEPIRPAPTVPDDAPVVCTVTTIVTGTGEWETPPCTLTADGYYVWVERIDSANTPAEEGGERLRPWQSAFGIATEVTRVVTPPTPSTPPTTPPTPATTVPTPDATVPAVPIVPSSAFPAPAALADTGTNVDPTLAGAAGALTIAGVGMLLVASLRRRSWARARTCTGNRS